MEELIDISTVKIDSTKSKAERIESFIRQIKNPYCYKDKDVTVEVSFSSNGESLEHCLRDYLQGV